MRKLILLLILLLTVSGVWIVFGTQGAESGWAKALYLTHIWGGLFFAVVFPMYVWDHVSANRAWLRVAAWVTVSGTGQLASGAVLILSGIVLLLYGDQAWQGLRDLHHWLTYPLLGLLAVHFLSPKWPGE